MLYDYECSNCKHQLKDVYQSIKDDALTLCPSCNTDNLYRIIYGGLGSFMKDSKTIGQLADKNWSNLGHYKRSEIESKNSGKKEEQNKKSLQNKINKMTAKQKERYIITGEK